MAPKLEARAKQEYRFGAVTAFSGHEYIQSEWRPVPAGYEEQARVHDLLEVREIISKQEPAEETPVVEEVKGTADEYLADKKGTADEYVEEVKAEAKSKRRKKTVTVEDAQSAATGMETGEK